MSEETNPNGIQVGDQIDVEQAWEDEAGNFHDETPTVLAINAETGELSLDFGVRAVNEFLACEAQFFAKDYKRTGTEEES